MPEAVEIIQRTKMRSNECWAMMDNMVSQKWAPTSLYMLRRILRTVKLIELVIDNAWLGTGYNGGGRKRMFQKEHVDEFVGQWK